MLKCNIKEKIVIAKVKFWVSYSLTSVHILLKIRGVRVWVSVCEIFVRYPFKDWVKRDLGKEYTSLSSTGVTRPELRVRANLKLYARPRGHISPETLEHSSWSLICFTLGMQYQIKRCTCVCILGVYTLHGPGKVSITVSICRVTVVSKTCCRTLMKLSW